MERPSVRRDPTIVVVVVVLVVIGLVVLVAKRPGSDPTPTSGPIVISTTPTPSSPVLPDSTAPVTPSGSPTRRTRPDQSPLKATGKRVCVAQTPDTDLTVVDYNIKSGHGGGTLAQIAATLRTAGADVVLLQEVDVHRASSHGVDMPAYFGSQLGMYHAFGTNVDHGHGGLYGTAVLSKFPIVSVENTHLPRPGSTQQRGLLHVVIDVHGTQVSVYDTHLQNLDQSARIAQMHMILGIVDADPRPQIFGGDFNSQPDSPPSVLARTHFTDTWATVGVGTGRTHPANHLRGRIDYLYSANGGITPLHSDVLPARLSDHLAVRASYQIAAPDTQVCVQMLNGSN